MDDSNVLGYTALDSFESWASNEAPLLGLDFDQATLFSRYYTLSVYVGPVAYSEIKISLITRDVAGDNDKVIDHAQYSQLQRCLVCSP